MEKTANIGREYRLLTALCNGKSFTVKQIRQQFKLKNPSAAIDRFSKKGIKIERTYTTKKTRINSLSIPITTVKYSVITSVQSKRKNK